MSDIELKPCPFCGNEVSIYKPEPHIYDYTRVNRCCVCCTYCDLLFGYDEDYGGDFITPEEAATEWNRRV